MPDLPRVTHILASAGLVETQWFKDYDLERGSALHAAAHYLDDGDLDWSTVDPVVLPRLRQYQKFLDEVRPEILAIEEEVVNEALQYVGHLDRRVRINGQEGILDLKGPSRAPWQALQLSLYAGCFTRPMKRWALHLSDDHYNLIEHKDRRDWEAAKACLTLVAWKERNGNVAH